MELTEYLDAYASKAAFWLSGVQNPDYPMKQFGHLTETVSGQLRTLAIATLQVEANTDVFYHNLIRSGLAREKFLQRCRQENFADFHLAISRSGAFFDALAAGEFDLSRRIAELSSEEWVQNGEYEEDYCFSRFFHLALLEGVGQPRLASLLERFEKALDGESDPHLELCRALAARDQAAFDSAFDAYLAGHDEPLEEDGGQMEDAHVVAERRIFVEGLAALRMAERLGLQTRPEYKYCPALARRPMVAPFPGK